MSLRLCRAVTHSIKRDRSNLPKNVPAQHSGVLMTGLPHNHPFAHPSHRCSRHEPCAKTVTAVVNHIDLKCCQGSFDCPRHAQTTQCVISHMSPTINRP